MDPTFSAFENIKQIENPLKIKKVMSKHVCMHEISFVLTALTWVKKLTT